MVSLHKARAQSYLTRPALAPRYKRDHEKLLTRIVWMAVRDSIGVPSKPRRGNSQPSTFTEMKRNYKYKLRDKAQAREWLQSKALEEIWHHVSGASCGAFQKRLEHIWKTVGNNKKKATRILRSMGILEAR